MNGIQEVRGSTPLGSTTVLPGNLGFIPYQSRLSGTILRILHRSTFRQYADHVFALQLTRAIAGIVLDAQVTDVVANQNGSASS